MSGVDKTRIETVMLSADYNATESSSSSATEISGFITPPLKNSSSADRGAISDDTASDYNFPKHDHVTAKSRRMTSFSVDDILRDSRPPLNDVSVQSMTSSECASRLAYTEDNG